jgi:cellulose synthase/poly-beta-1,6-N-acetylglucosamine synthase-like glycosyltransferase
MSPGQIIVLGCALFATAFGLIFWTVGTQQLLIDVTLVLTFCIVGLKVVLHFASVTDRTPALSPVPADDPYLPVYTVLVPLYKESDIVPKLVQSLDRLRYPTKKLQILLLLEEGDSATRAAIIELAEMKNLPAHFTTIVVPSVPTGSDGNPVSGEQPQGKPRALNVGLAHAIGDFCVIYDAEDEPDPDQLLLAVAKFRTSSADTACVQAPLQFWNQRSSWIARFYGAEYVVHYSFVLPGLARLGLIPPLGGTSNHFRTATLKSIAFPEDSFPPLPGGCPAVYGWDPFNVTEDAELSGALAARGYRVAIIDSVTFEESITKVAAADRQRRRWHKGYLQTGLVYTRHPISTARDMGVVRWFCFNLMMLGTPISLMVNPIYWLLTLTYIVTGSTYIQHLFPGGIYYFGTMLMLVNIPAFWQLVQSCLHRDSYGSVKYMLLAPVWWTFTSWSAFRILPELAMPTLRYRWNKTSHGHDILRDKEVETENRLDEILD